MIIIIILLLLIPLLFILLLLIIIKLTFMEWHCWLQRWLSGSFFYVESLQRIELQQRRALKTPEPTCRSSHQIEIWIAPLSWSKRLWSAWQDFHKTCVLTWAQIDHSQQKHCRIFDLILNLNLQWCPVSIELQMYTYDTSEFSSLYTFSYANTNSV